MTPAEAQAWATVLGAQDGLDPTDTTVRLWLAPEADAAPLEMPTVPGVEPLVLFTQLIGAWPEVSARRHQQFGTRLAPIAAVGFVAAAAMTHNAGEPVRVRMVTVVTADHVVVHTRDGAGETVELLAPVADAAGPEVQAALLLMSMSRRELA